MKRASDIEPESPSASTGVVSLAEPDYARNSITKKICA
jgi:hypothetical protein